jgi:tRNA G18 (ribose-2'-O)-methylase SpoU
VYEAQRSTGAPSRFVIADPNDERISDYRAVRDRDLRGRGGRFMAEGEVVVRLLFSESSRFAAESLLIAERRISALEPLLGRVPAHVPVYLAPQDVMDEVVGFRMHRGVLAVGRRGEELGAAPLLRSMPSRASVVCLLEIANHDNVGGVFRNAAAFGAEAVLLDRRSCDPLYRKAIRVSVGAALTVPFGWATTGVALMDALDEAGFQLFALSPSGATAIGEVDWPDRTALLVGSEGAGLRPAILSRAPGLRIPMSAGFDSLNVATATGIALHEVSKGRRRTAAGPVFDSGENGR